MSSRTLAKRMVTRAEKLKDKLIAMKYQAQDAGLDDLAEERELQDAIERAEAAVQYERAGLRLRKDILAMKRDHLRELKRRMKRDFP